ncbi:hypothetical protein MAR_013055 [Mya arenaria]|uniref:Uncharacterized protein n=1 Tax=Mya arenaria TaxID=6604 RepID=A0ABY7G2W0_MYAAR|nr:hypothetical protein MAR_013055 [Mya arenaria]
MDDDDEDVYQKNLFDRYSARPDSLEDICLPQQTATKITLKDGQGFMIKRNKPAIIRTHQWSVKKQPEPYYHAKLLLYHPWRNETNDLLTKRNTNSPGKVFYKTPYCLNTLQTNLLMCWKT